MVYIFYNSINGKVLDAYDESCLPNIPTPNIAIENEVWKKVNQENRECHVDLKEFSFVVGDKKPDPNANRPKRYSKLKIIRALKAQGIWTQVKEFIVQNDYQDEWDACTYLASDDEMFTAVKTTLAAAYPDVNVDDLLKNCLY